MNPNKQIQIEKITLNFGAGKDQNLLEKGMKLIEYITGIKPVKTKSTKRIPGWGLRPGLPIGCKLTIRDPKLTKDLLSRFLKAKDNKLVIKQFDNQGNVAFGIHEYIDIPDTKYNPDIGIMGFEICITLKRNGYRIKNRRIKNKKVPNKHRVNKEDAIEFMKKEFKINVGEE